MSTDPTPDNLRAQAVDHVRDELTDRLYNAIHPRHGINLSHLRQLRSWQDLRRLVDLVLDGGIDLAGGLVLMVGQLGFAEQRIVDESLPGGEVTVPAYYRQVVPQPGLPLPRSAAEHDAELSTDLPKGAIDLGIHEGLDFDDGSDWASFKPHRIVAIPVAEPEPEPTLAERMRDFYDPAHGGPEMVGAFEAMIDALGLVCREDLPTEGWVSREAFQAECDISNSLRRQRPDTPTVSQVMEALGFLPPADNGYHWTSTRSFRGVFEVAERLAAIGIPPDAEEA